MKSLLNSFLLLCMFVYSWADSIEWKAKKHPESGMGDKSWAITWSRLPRLSKHTPKVFKGVTSGLQMATIGYLTIITHRVWMKIMQTGCCSSAEWLRRAFEREMKGAWEVSLLLDMPKGSVFSSIPHISLLTSYEFQLTLYLFF